ncbi:MAG: T9SS type A sorting domain-containing protein, partial [Bacteroidota bacterium]
QGLITLADTVLSYHIRFQNTGTDTAFTVVIRDTLDNDLNLRSLVPGPSSHAYELDVLPNRVLEFTFNDIHLPDSNTNEPASHGFVFFDIEVANRSLGTRIENSVGIYFDYNAPIITNTVLNTYYRPALVSQTDVSICEGEAYNGVIYMQDVTLTDTLAGPYTDSIFITNVEVLPSQDINQSVAICIGDSFEGFIISMDTTLVASFTNSSGCDSIITTFIDAIPPNNTLIEIDLCEGESYNGIIYFSDTTLVEVLNNTSGCDSTVTTQVQVANEFTVDIFAGVCPGESYNGQVIFSDTVFVSLLQSTGGCDSTINEFVELLAEDEVFVEEEYCFGETNQDPGIYTNVLTNQEGCDSTVITTVSVFDIFQITIDTTLMSGATYDGMVFLNDTSLINTFQTVEGCDSIVTVNISVNPVGLDNQLALSSLQLYPNPAYSMVQLDLELAMSTEVQLMLYDITGRNHLTHFQAQILPAGRHQIPLAIDHLPNGTYTLWLRTEDGLWSRRLVKIQP